MKEFVRGFFGEFLGTILAICAFLFACYIVMVILSGVEGSDRGQCLQRDDRGCLEWSYD